jgi:hypothetical protein
MIDTWMQALGDAIRANVWTAPLFALLAGLLTAFTPCSLSTVPLVIGYVGRNRGTGSQARVPFFARLCDRHGGHTDRAGHSGLPDGPADAGDRAVVVPHPGGLMVLMALQTWEVITIIPSPA